MLRNERMRRRPATAETMTAKPDDNDTIDLVELFFRLLASLKYIVAAATVCALAAGAYTYLFLKPLYSATSKLYVTAQSDSAINLSDLQIGAYLTQDYQEVFKTWEVHEMVIQNLKLNYTYAQMQSMLTVGNPSDTRILYITVTSDDAKEATDIANEYANVVRKYISQTMATEEPNILSVALVPTKPVSPSKTRNILLGFLIGTVGAVGIVLVRFMVDDRIRTPDDIGRCADMLTLSIVPMLGGQAGPKGKPSGKRNRKGTAK